MRRQLTRLMPWVPAFEISMTCSDGRRGAGVRVVRFGAGSPHWRRSITCGGPAGVWVFSCGRPPTVKSLLTQSQRRSPLSHCLTDTHLVFPCLKVLDQPAAIGVLYVAINLARPQRLAICGAGWVGE